MSRLAPLALVLVLALPPAARARRDPADTGPFAVGTTTVTLVDASRGRTLVTDLWYPARHAGTDAAPRGRHPLVLVVHGHCGSRLNYHYLGSHLASRGYVVAAPDLPVFCLDRGGVDTTDPPGDLAFLRATFEDRGGPLARFAPHVRAATAGLVGHSLGGQAVMNAALADARFPAVVGLAPLADAGTGASFKGLTPPRAVMVIGGTADTLLPFAAFQQPFFDALPAPAWLVRITGGTHSGFDDQDAHLGADLLATQHRAVQRWATPFLDRFLRRRRRASRWLAASDDGTVAVTVKAQ